MVRRGSGQGTRSAKCRRRHPDAPVTSDVETVLVAFCRRLPGRSPDSLLGAQTSGGGAEPNSTGTTRSRPPVSADLRPLQDPRQRACQ